MKKWLKITLISLGSLIGVVAIAFAVVCWIVFTPSQLTKIVNSLADKYVTCDTNFEDVDLTIFSTFPNAGVKVSNVYVVNPVDGAPSDTLAHLASLTVGVDVRAFISNGDIIVHQLLVDNVDANLYIAPDGTNNFSVFPPSEEETSSSEPFSLPDNVDISKINISNLSCRYLDSQAGIDANLSNLDATLRGTLKNNNLNADLDLILQSLAYAQYDSIQRDSATMSFTARDFATSLSAQGSLSDISGKLIMQLHQASVEMPQLQYAYNSQYADKYELVDISAPYHVNLDSGTLQLSNASLAVANICLNLSGSAMLPDTLRPTSVDMTFSTNDISVEEVLQWLPEQYVSMVSGMNLHASLSLNGTATGVVSDSLMPMVACNAKLHDGKLTYANMSFNDIAADLSAMLDLSRRQPSSAVINSLQASYRHNKATLSGTVDDLMGDMRIDAKIDADARLDEIGELLPDTMPLLMNGNANVNINVKTSLQQITDFDLKNMKVNGTVNLVKLDATYDSMHFASPQLSLDISLPSASYAKSASELIHAAIAAGRLDMQMPSSKLDVALTNANVDAFLSDVTKTDKPIDARLSVQMARGIIDMDSTSVDAEKLAFNGKVHYDATAADFLSQLSPQLSFSLNHTLLNMPQLPEAIRLTSFIFDYKPGETIIKEVDVNWGLSDYHLSGKVLDLEDWIAHKKPLYGILDFSSQYADVDQLLDLISGIGSNEDTLALQRTEDNVDTSANPFIVPKDVDFTLNTHIHRCVALGNDLSDLAGSISIRDGKAILDQVGFACKAARMQLTGIYKSPRPNHLYLGVDFHLLDIRIDELIDMVPYIDTLVPMLTSFSGNANFHLALEGYLDAHYSPKVSTLLGSAAIDGSDLVVLDNETFSQIASLLMFNKKTINKIDSLDVEMTLFRNKMEVYPFLLSMDKYRVCASGIHSLDNAYNYHIELLKSPLPLRLAVDVKGTLPDIGISLGKVRYQETFNPTKVEAVKQRSIEIKNQVRQALQSNVRK